VSDPWNDRSDQVMEYNADLPAMLAALVFAGMLALYTQVIAVRRKDRLDSRRFRERMRRNHGARRRHRQAPPDA
jgi:hypothetical protein